MREIRIVNPLHSVNVILKKTPTEPAGSDIETKASGSDSKSRMVEL